MSLPEDVEASLLELGINVRDYESYRAKQLADAITLLKSIPRFYGKNLKAKLAA